MVIKFADLRDDSLNDSDIDLQQEVQRLRIEVELAQRSLKAGYVKVEDIHDLLPP
jgi:hypothetical protein